MTELLVAVPCGGAKIWDKEPLHGSTPARDAYVGPPFKVNRQYAERFGDRWLILSAKYGFVWPEEPIPGPYNVTFNDPATRPVSIDVLRQQVKSIGLERYGVVIGLGGKHYRNALLQAFAGTGVGLEFPFAGLPIGKAMRATLAAIRAGQPLGVSAGR
jgi:hypothetical protein